MRNPFCYWDTPTIDKHHCFVEPENIREICEALIQRHCCLIVGPPGSGTSTTLCAVQRRFQQELPLLDWWYIDLGKLPHESSEALFRSLAEEGKRRYQNQSENWSNVVDEESFCRALRQSSHITARPVYLGIDHIEAIPREIARIVVRGVRSIHVNWDTGRAPRLITVALAGSHRLIRQAVDKGSPLNFAKIHSVNDWSWDEANRLMQQVSEFVHFAEEAAFYLFDQTNGDKYLFQRLAYDCTEKQNSQAQISNPIQVNLADVREVITHFVRYGYEDDPRLSGLIPELIKNSEALQHVLALIEEKSTSEFEDTTLDRLNYSISITRALKRNGRTVQIRNPVFGKILKRKIETLRAALQSTQMRENDIARLRKIYRLEQQAKIASQSSDLPSGLLHEIATLAEAEEAILLQFDGRDQIFRFHASSASEKDYVGLAIEDSQSLIRKHTSENQLMTCNEIPKLCIGDCREKRDGYSCDWRLLSVNDGIEVGALVFRRRPWAVSAKKNHEISGLLATLAETLRTHRRSIGLHQLATIAVSCKSEHENIEKLCDAITNLFNASRVFLWTGHRTDATLTMKLASPDLLPSWSKLNMDDWLESKDLEKYSQLTPVNVKTCNDLQKRTLSQMAIESVLFISFDYHDRVGVLGIASHTNWVVTNVEYALASVVMAQTVALLSNLRTIATAKQSVESNRLGVQLLNHQLSRSPSLIMRETELLLESKRGAVSVAQRKSLQKIQSWIERHNSLLDRLLDLTRWEAGKLSQHMNDEDLSSVVEQIVVDLEPEISSVGMTLEFESNALPGATNQVDRILLAAALENLIHNAIQYAGQGKILVRVTNRDKQPCIEVEDQGPSIPDEFQEAVFFAYNRGARKSSTAEPDNLGLGLFLVQKTMELHHGIAFCDSDYHHGTRIVLLFP